MLKNQREICELYLPIVEIGRLAVRRITQQFDFTKKLLKYFESTILIWKFKGHPVVNYNLNNIIAMEDKKKKIGTDGKGYQHGGNLFERESGGFQAPATQAASEKVTNGDA
ncbi:hypothetical protein [Emticicia sp. C21]|uniref:hypothetical protein n=1 Tax=Emticicia sp. C21 TaxID=2302915 RepID=UPI000E340750|nr:hypothetical protein [Emticicia sp. C21]RFS15150.1 hypothetical protein D0T08_16590 [Emticicia sp. C21]